VIVVVTGGAGFVGLNLVQRLLMVPECQIRIIDDFSNSSPEHLAQAVAGGGAARVRVIKADVVNAQAVNEAMAGTDAVVHLAAQTGIAPSLADPRRDLEQNVIGTFNILDACRTAETRRCVIATSAAVLGNAVPPQHENLPPRPLSPYGAGKAACEAYCSAFCRSFGIEAIALRFANVYGPLSWNKGSVVAAFAKRCLAAKPLIINGDGAQTRDFLYVEDLCEILVRAALSPLGPAQFGAPCNVATGVQTRIVDLARAIAAVFGSRGRNCDIEFGPPLASDVAVSAPATDHLKSLFPGSTFRKLEEGLSTTVDWFLANWPARTAGA
jgi:UDP-glucose 4-epimerase